MMHLSIKKNSLILAIFAIVCTAIVGLVNEMTKARIVRQEQQQLLNTLHSMFVMIVEWVRQKVHSLLTD